MPWESKTQVLPVRREVEPGSLEFWVGLRELSRDVWCWPLLSSCLSHRCLLFLHRRLLHLLQLLRLQELQVYLLQEE